MTRPSSSSCAGEPGLLEGVDDQGRGVGLAVAQGALGVAAELRRGLLVIGVGTREEPLEHRVLRLAGGSGEVEHRLERVGSHDRDGPLVAQQLHELRRQRPQQVGLEAGERRDDVPTAPVPGESAHELFSMVAHRPYSCIAWTSRSISSRVPVLTTDLPSLCTSPASASRPSSSGSRSRS